MLLYIYSWKYEDHVLHAYGLNESSSIIHCMIRDFRPFLYVELPSCIQWTDDLIDQVVDQHMKCFEENGIPTPLHHKEQCKHLYYASKQSTVTCIRYSFSTNKFFPFLHAELEKPITITRNVDDDWKEDKNIKCAVHEYDVPVEIQYVCENKLQTTGWVEMTGKETDARHRFDHCVLTTVSDHTRNPPHPTGLAFDLEVYSEKDNRFPNANVPSDVIFQISCVFWRDNDVRTYLLVLGECNPIPNVKVISLKSEGDLIQTFAQLIRQENPSVITGWNITGFDFNYIIQRSAFHGLQKTTLNLGVDDVGCRVYSKTFAKTRTACHFYDWDGRIVIDMLSIARRDIKSENYKLDTIASMLVEKHKDPMTAKDIFEAYRACNLTRQSNGVELMTRCGVYCVKDSDLVRLLFDKMDVWVGSCEMAAVCSVPLTYLFTHGQQWRVYTQVYRYCNNNNILVQKDAYVTADGEQYQGAYVKDPVPGIYDYVVPFDFQSLYPSLIVAYNIDYSTYVTDPSIPDEQCHVMEWTEDHLYDEHWCFVCKTVSRGVRSNTHNKYLSLNSKDQFSFICTHCQRKKTVTVRDCAKYPGAKTIVDKVCIPSGVYTDTYRYRFLKEPKGVLPTIIINLLDARARVRKQMKQITDGNMKRVLNQRQLSYKTSANSMYGALGVKAGLLPLMPGAMCVTAMGRKSLHKAAHHLVERYGVNWVYSDTDSTYVQFPGLPPDQIWSHARQIEREMVEEGIFPSPMVLKFEECVYHPFFILTKKRYMYCNYSEDGTYSAKIGKKGVILARRGSSRFLHNTYEHVVGMILKKETKNSILDYLVEQMNRCCSYSLSIENYMISKRVSAHYANGRALPAHAQLAQTMRDRGTMVTSGERIEYIVTLKNRHDTNMSKRVEHVTFQKEHSIPVDHLYYIHSLIKQIDELLEVAFGISNFTKNQYKARVCKTKVNEQIRSIFQVKLVFL